MNIAIAGILLGIKLADVLTERWSEGLGFYWNIVRIMRWFSVMLTPQFKKRPMEMDVLLNYAFKATIPLSDPLMQARHQYADSGYRPISTRDLRNLQISSLIQS